MKLKTATRKETNNASNGKGEGMKNNVSLDGVSAFYLTLAGAGIERKRKSKGFAISENSLIKVVRKLYKGRS